MKIKAEISDEELKFEEILKAIRTKKIKQGLTVTFNHSNDQIIYILDGEIGDDVKKLKDLLN